MKSSAPETFIRRLKDGARGRIILVALGSPKGAISRAFSSPKDAALQAERWSESGLNAYVEVHDTRAIRRSKADDIIAWSGVTLDLDDDKADGGREGVEKALGEMPLKPTLVVDTGGGLHAYWLLHAPEPIRDEKHGKHLRSIADRWATACGSDRTTDLPRILRVPGTTNYPAPHKRQAGRVDTPVLFVVRNGPRYNVSDLEKASLPHRSVPVSPPSDTGAESRLPRSKREDDRAQRIKDHVSLDEAMRWLGFDVTGKDRQCCPIHGGENPESLVLFRSDGRWYCHSSRHEGPKSGDVIEMVSQSLRVDFLDACEWLEEKASLRPVTAPPVRPEPRPTPVDSLEAVRALLPDGLLRDFVDLFGPISPSPPIYLLGDALALGSATIGNRIYARRGDEIVRPCLWILMVGDSGRYRKSTAARFAVRVLRDLDETRDLPVPASTSALVESLIEHPDGWLYAGELSSLLRAAAYSSGSDFLATLCTLYDEGYAKTCARGTKDERTSGKQVILRHVKHVSMTILTASSPEFLSAAFGGHTGRGGLLQRFIYVVADEPLIPEPFPPEADQAKRSALLDGLSALRRQLTPDPVVPNRPWLYSYEAKAYYRRWHRAVEGKAYRGEVADFLVRIAALPLKLALIYQASMLCGSTTIGEETMALACKTADVLGRHTLRFVSEQYASTIEEAKAKKILRLAREMGSTGMNRRDIVRRVFFKTSRDREDTISGLIDAGYLVETGKGNRRRLFARDDAERL